MTACRAEWCSGTVRGGSGGLGSPGQHSNEAYTDMYEGRNIRGVIEHQH